MYARKVSLHVMDTWQERIQGMKGSERVHSLPFMIIKPSGSKALSAAYEFE